MVARHTPADDDGAGFLKRRALRIQRSGVIAIGPRDLRPAPAPPTRQDDIRRHRQQTAADREHRRTVERELAAVGARASEIRQQLGQDGQPRRGLAVGPKVFIGDVTLGATGAGSFRDQELERELGALAVLRREIAADLAKGPPAADDRTRALLRMRTREIAEDLARQAGRLDSQGEHREARQRRHDSLRARHLAERELGIRASVRGYDFAG